MASSYVEHTEPLSMSFGVWTQVGPRNRRSQIPPGEGAVLGGLLPAHCVHTHTHPFNGPISGTTRVSRYQKGKTSLDFTEARDSEWQWHQLGHMQVCTSSRQITTPAPHYSVFYRPDALSAAQPTASKHWRQSLKVTWVINSAVGCHYFPPGPQLPSQPLRGPLPISLIGEQRHDGCEQFA